MLRLIWKSLWHRRIQNLALGAAVMVSVSLLFAVGLMQYGLQGGLLQAKDQLGADLLVVPEGVTIEPGEILYGGAPKNIYMPASAAERVADVPGVSQVSVQFFSQTLQADCCDFGETLRLVGIDLQHDRLAAAWRQEAAAAEMTPLQPDDILVGSRVAAQPGQHFFILGRMFRVAGVLAASGSGLDRSILLDIDTARELTAQSPVLQDKLPLGAEKSISAVLVELAPGADGDTVRAAIAKQPGVQVFSAAAAKQRIYTDLHMLLQLMGGVSLLMAVLSLIQLFANLYTLVEERKPRLGLYLALGVSPCRLGAFVGAEALLLCTAGALPGLGLGYGLYGWLAESISSQQAFPFLPVPAGTVLLSGAGLLLAFLLLGSLAAAGPAWRSAHIEPKRVLLHGEID
jgi:putative ABC transport system permease protein